MSRLHPEDVTLHHHADRDTDVTDLVPIDTPTKQAIAHACRWDVRHGTARLNGRQVQQMAELVALVGSGECQGCDSRALSGSVAASEGRSEVRGGSRGVPGAPEGAQGVDVGRVA